MLWKKWYNEDKPELEALPKQQKNCGPFDKMLFLRAIRSDRLISALTEFVKVNMGEQQVVQEPFDIQLMFTDSTNQTPIFFVLFPGVDPTPAVEKLGAEQGKSILEKTFVNIPMGQGQEKVAENALDLAAKEGHWIMLQNIHLMENWSKVLEVRLEKAMLTAHDEFRC